MIENEKKTAPVSSVGADEEQSVYCVNSIISKSTAIINDPDNNTAERLKKLQRISDPAYLPAFSLDEILESSYSKRQPVIENLLYSGAYILAGAPKYGKSFLVAQIAYHVSKGIPIWGYPVTQGKVLYLALEDDYSRIQNRMYKMFGAEGTNQLFFAISAKQLSNGLNNQMQQFIKEHSDMRLIIIDTLQKIRECCSSIYSYSSDYEIIGQLKQFADQNNICLLIVHHTRKQVANDSFDMISGTNGLMGCADGALILQKETRTSREATLDITGRDQQDQRLYLVRDNETLTWELDHLETDLWKDPPNPILDAIANFVDMQGGHWSGFPSSLTAELNLNKQPNVLSRILNINKGRLYKEHGIMYENAHTHEGRIISLARK